MWRSKLVEGFNFALHCRMAPEVMLCETFHEKHYNKLADVWSFGITLIEMAEEKPPYAEMNPAKVIFKVGILYVLHIVIFFKY